MMKIAIPLMVAALVATGCTDRNKRVLFDGQFFRAKVSKVDGQRHVFTVRVRDVAKSLDGARAAGEFEGISYCVENYGSSKIDWTVGPQTPPEQLRIVDDSITFQGVCPQV